MRLLEMTLGATVALGALQVGAETVAETYQAALMAEKGSGELEKAIQLYEEVVRQHDPARGEIPLAARAQVRIGVCQEKLGLHRARDAYSRVTREFSDQPEAVVTAAERLQSSHQREVELSAQEELLDGRSELGSLAGTNGSLQSLLDRTLPGRSEEVQRQVQEAHRRAQEAFARAQVEVQRALGLGPGASSTGRAASRPYAGYAFAQPRIPYPHQSVATVPAKWRFMFDLGPFDPKRGLEGSRRDVEQSTWSTTQIEIGQAWEDQGYTSYDQGGWYRAQIEVDAPHDDRPVLMAFGGVDLDGYVYINGKFVGEHHVWDQPFILDISEAVDRHGQNAVVIYVYDGLGMGGIYGLIDIHQPGQGVDVTRWVANRGGSVAGVSRTTPSVRVPSIGGGFQENYGSYAFTQPLIPYACRTVAEVPLRWEFLRADGLAMSSLTRTGAEFSTRGYDAQSWAQIEVRRAWEDQGHHNYDGAAWYRTEFEVKADKGPVYMAFGGADEDAYVYLNGRFVGEHHDWNVPFILDISDAVERSGTNAVAVYVRDSAGMGGLYGLIDVHQATEKVDAGRWVANRGGSLRQETGPRSGSPWLRRLLRPGDRYAAWAGTRVRPPFAFRTVGTVPARWRLLQDHGTPSTAQYEEHVKADYDDGDWAEIEIGRAWEDQGYQGYDEGAWYRAQVAVEAQKDRPVYLAFGGVDRDAWVYVNGQFVGEHHEWDQPFHLDISSAVRRHGANSVAVRVYDGAGMGGIYGMVEVVQPLAEVLSERPQR
ncbi:MAG: sugar-binding domain-containing protein [Candidatus Latescibacterota bacterium]